MKVLPLLLPVLLPAAEWRPLEPPGEGNEGFLSHPPGRTGIDFVNHLDPDAAEDNRILENGSGVAAGDGDGDGLCDLYFCRLEGPNVLYRNRGGFRFEDITAEAGVACAGQHSSGAVLADLDGDGDADLLVTGPESGIRSFRNDGGGRFAERTGSGLDRTSAATSLALADADGDGDLDLYAACYRARTWKDLSPGIRPPRITRSGGRPVAWPTDRYRVLSLPDGRTEIVEVGQPDAFHLNDGTGRFRRVDWTGGAFLEADGTPLREAPRHWGLAVAFRDFDGDRRPDIHVCNDFLDGNDDLFLNTGGGVFRRVAPGALAHSSWSSMAVDVADIDRDGHFDFLVVDMLSPDPVRRLTQQANADTGRRLHRPGVFLDRPQVQQNTLHLNRGDGTWAEIARLAGLEASGWSWSVVFLDVDLDGWEDVLVGNGHAHDLLDMDATLRAMEALRRARGRRVRSLGHYPPLPLADRAWRNRGDLVFVEAGPRWGFDRIGITQGIARADLDNDGDWDLALNSLQAPAAVLENTGSAPRIQVQLRGTPPNTAGIGALVRLVPETPGGPAPQQREMSSGGRYLSGDQSRLVFAAGGSPSGFRLEVDWPGGGRTIVPGVRPGRLYRIPQGTDGPPPPPEEEPPAWFEDVSHLLGHVHRDDLFDDLRRQPLLPRLHSRPGPCLIWADTDRDGHEDLLVTAGRGGRPALLRNRGGRGFDLAELAPVPAGQTGALWMESHLAGLFSVRSNYHDGNRSVPALEFRSGPSLRLLDLGLPGQGDTAGPLVSLDIDGDGDLDLFLGGRIVPGAWPRPATSRLYRNQGGRFRLDLEGSRAFHRVGRITAALASDPDGDGDPDLFLAEDWGPLQLWINRDGRFTDATREWGLDRFRGMWNGLAAADFDEDGRMDLAAANQGRNTGYRHSGRLRHGDLDGNGTVEIVELVRDPLRSRWVPRRGLAVLRHAIPQLNRVPSHRAFAEQGPEAFLGPAWDAMEVLEADRTESIVLLNRTGAFLARPLPVEAQFAPAFGVVAADFTGDGHENLFLAQNLFAVRPETLRHDAGTGLLLAGRGDGSFTALSPRRSGIRLHGEQRGAAAADFDGDGRLDLAVGQNAATTRLLVNRRAPKAHRVRLEGPPHNPRAVGARLRRKDGRGPLREIDGVRGPLTLWPAGEEFVLQVRWPDGTLSERTLAGRAREWTIGKDRLDNPVR